MAERGNGAKVDLLSRRAISAGIGTNAATYDTYRLDFLVQSLAML
jgi:hypothetical protein